LFDEDHYRRFLITVRHDGHARWQPGGVYAISCALDMVFYPFDDQLCTMELETWVYTADKVNLTNTYDKIDLDNYVKHGDWDIIKTGISSVNRVSYTSRLSYLLIRSIFQEGASQEKVFLLRLADALSGA